MSLDRVFNAGSKLGVVKHSVLRQETCPSRQVVRVSALSHAIVVAVAELWPRLNQVFTSTAEQ